jgi:hypothetical protein
VKEWRRGWVHSKVAEDHAGGALPDLANRGERTRSSALHLLLRSSACLEEERQARGVLVFRILDGGVRSRRIGLARSMEAAGSPTGEDIARAEEVRRT